ncbi:hypothetical protein SK128_027544 [Halocaridina rubra]|uniref:Uncharacterized protein n=1 Tax=Halocaridina rubra TaxID=373956 RepID=A0AAN8XTD0_HALRR
MLKWLVTKGPTTASQPPRKVVTDDPLATFRVKSKDNTHQIYAVSRVNPLYHDEEVEITTGPEEEDEEEEENMGEASSGSTRKNRDSLPESPPTDRGSVRSSGYGSKETDSVSEGSEEQDEDDLLGAEVEAALEPPPAPSPFSDSPKKPVRNTQSSILSDINIHDLKSNGNVGAVQSVAQLCKSFENLNKPKPTSPTLLTSGGNAVAAIMAQHPQFVKAIEVGIRRTKSLETFQQRRELHASRSSTVPRPIWPRYNSSVDNLGTQAKRQEQDNTTKPVVSTENAVREYIPSPVDIVKQDLRYVTSIQVSPTRPLSRAKTFTEAHQYRKQQCANNSSEHVYANSFTPENKVYFDSEKPRVSRYFGSENHSTEFPLLSLQPDSLVTEDTLKMMRYSGYEDIAEEQSEQPIHADEKDVQVPLPDFSQLMYTRGLYSTLNRAASLSTKDIVKPPYKTRSRSIDISIPSRKHSAKKRGLSSMKGLWEKSGLKTNGRKLIVDVNDLLDDSTDENDHNGSSVENPRSFQSVVTVNAMQPSPQRNNQISSIYQNSHTYEDPDDFNLMHTRHSVLRNRESSLSDDYIEINDITPNGIDNPAFLDDSGHNRYITKAVTIHDTEKQRFLNPDRLAEFQKKISEKLQGAPHHRTQWLDLDEIVIDGYGDKQERRVTFTSDTINPGSLDRKGLSQNRSRSPPLPGGAVRSSKDGDIEFFNGRHLPEVTLKPSHLVDGVENQRKLWTSSESYRDRFQEAPPGTVGRGRRQQLWETYYGTNGSMDRTLPRHLAPHPNSQAPICANPGTCHDFTLDLRRSHKLQVRSVARQKRRRCYTIFLVITAFLVFLGMVVVISWYCTGGEKFFGSL